jgi:hypothetical protein
MRTLYFDPLPEDERPWVGNFTGKLKLRDTPFPYTTDGYISPQGYFFSVPPMNHSGWCSQYGLSALLLERLGWVAVWSYKSFLIKDKKFHTLFRWDHQKRLSEDQKAKMISWCEGQGKTLQEALGWQWEDFHEEVSHGKRK